MAAVFAFGRAKGIPIGSVLIVSDRVSEQGWEIGFFSQALKSTRKHVIQTFADHLCEAFLP